MQQIVDWCGREQFDGCLIFDESHKAKNFLPGKDGMSGSNASSKLGIAVSQLQLLLPKARVVYTSATGVTEIKDFAFMERLGLWYMVIVF